MLGFLKKKEVDKKPSICEETVWRALELIITHTKDDFKFIKEIDVLEKEVLSDERIIVKLLIKHNNGTSVEVSTAKNISYFVSDLEENIERAVTETWHSEFEDLVSSLRKSAKTIGEFDKYRTDEDLIRLTYLGTRYRMPITEVIKFDDKLRESKIDPVYENVRLIDRNCTFQNAYADTGTTMNIYRIAKWWIDRHS